MNIFHDSGLTYCTDNEKGVLAECIARCALISRGYEVSKPENPASPYDLFIRNPLTGAGERIQIKTVSGENPVLKTSSTGAGKLKGGKRKKRDYVKAGIEWMMGVDILTLQVYAYPLQFFRNKSGINVLTTPSFDIPLIAERSEKKDIKNEEISTLDLLCN